MVHLLHALLFTVSVSVTDSCRFMFIRVALSYLAVR